MYHIWNGMIVWWLYDDRKMTLWWPYDDPMILWFRAVVEHLKVNVGLDGLYRYDTKSIASDGDNNIV